MGDKSTKTMDEEVYARNLPDLRTIQPRQAQNAVGEIFATRCRQIGERIIMKSDQEKETNIDNFDSGLGLEDIVREELSSLCPRRYTVTAGTIDDRQGCTGGDYEIVIADDFWTPILKAGATKASRKVHIPVEAVYGVVEVKQSLDLDILDSAVKKLATCHRLYRPPLLARQFLENQNVEFLLGLGDEEYHVRLEGEHPNPLFSAILAVNLKPDISFENLTSRFTLLNQQLKRQEVVQVLCVLREGCGTWLYFDDTGSKAALFRGDDLERSLYFSTVQPKDGYHPFYNFAVQLLRNLFLSRVVIDELPHAYGPISQNASFVFNHDLDMTHPPDTGKPKRSPIELQALQMIRESHERYLREQQSNSPETSK